MLELPQKTTIEGGPYRRGEWNVGKVSMLGREDARIDRNLGKLRAKTRNFPIGSPSEGSNCLIVQQS